MAKASKWLEASPGESLVEVAERALRSRLAALQYYLELAAAQPQEDMEHVHQLRVWSRRTRAATRAFAVVLPGRRVVWINRQLRAIRRASNEARDADVFAARLSADPADSHALRLLARVQAHRLHAQDAIAEVYRQLTRERRFENRVSELLKRVRWRGAQSLPPPFGEWAVARLRAAVETFLAAGTSELSSPEALHRFRICGKKLRYAMELFGGAFPETLRSEVYPLATALQEKLGQINDFATAADQLERWLEQSTETEDLAYLQTALADAQNQLEQTRTTFFAWWTIERQQHLRARFESLLAAGCPHSSCV
jgi:CHAD domain-containing protein